MLGFESREEGIGCTCVLGSVNDFLNLDEF
jgi:hypothetical protein